MFTVHKIETLLRVLLLSITHVKWKEKHCKLPKWHGTLLNIFWIKKFGFLTKLCECWSIFESSSESDQKFLTKKVRCFWNNTSWRWIPIWVKSWQWSVNYIVKWLCWWSWLSSECDSLSMCRDRVAGHWQMSATLESKYFLFFLQRYLW